MTSTPLYIEQETLFPWHLLMEAAVFLWKDWPKHMEIVYVGQQNFNMTGVCPHCNRPTVLTQTLASIFRAYWNAPEFGLLNKSRGSHYPMPGLQEICTGSGQDRAERSEV